jgi:hypothetical protein
MGLSFHYSGSIANPADLPELINEIIDIANVYSWPFNVLESTFPENHFGRTTFNNNLYGICFTPPGSESVFICFLSNGKMSGPAQIQLYVDPEKEEEKKYLYILSVKTQFAGPEVHMVLIQLLRYLSQKYFARFNMTDEGGYWETSEEAVLRENFRKYTDLLDRFSTALEAQSFNTKESIEDYLMRLVKLIHEKNKKRK